jgi:hypothetical protein
VILRVRLKLGVGLLAGAFIGTAAVSGMHAQGKAPVYLITEIDVTNPDAYGKEFAPTEQATIKAAGAKLMVIGGAGGANAKPTPQASLAPVNPRDMRGHFELVVEARRIFWQAKVNPGTDCSSAICPPRYDRARPHRQLPTRSRAGEAPAPAGNHAPGS